RGAPDAPHPARVRRHRAGRERGRDHCRPASAGPARGYLDRAGVRRGAGRAPPAARDGRGRAARAGGDLAHRLRIQVSRAAIAGARSPRGLGERHPGRGAPGHRRLSGSPSTFWLDSVRRCGLVSEARFPPRRRVGTREDDRQDKELGMSELTRRGFLRTGSAALAGAVAAGGLSGCASTKGETQPTGKRRVVVIGGGWGGATAAKYVRIGDPSIEVVLLEPNRQFISCPFSNLVLAGL